MKLIEIKPSTRKNKKLQAIFDIDGKKEVIHFGLKGSNTYLDHKNNEKKENYIARHEKREKTFWKNEPLTPASLSRFILWNKPTLKESIQDYKKRFNIK